MGVELLHIRQIDANAAHPQATLLGYKSLEGIISGMTEKQMHPDRIGTLTNRYDFLICWCTSNSYVLTIQLLRVFGVMYFDSNIFLHFWLIYNKGVHSSTSMVTWKQR